MRHSPTNERPVIVEIKVEDVEKRTKKNCEYVLKVVWSDESQYRLFRRYSMFFDLQAGLKQLFEGKQSITVPTLAVFKASQAGRMLFGANIKRQGKAIEEFCERILQLPATVSQCGIVEKFFSQWATDALINNNHEESSPAVLRRTLSHPVQTSRYDSREDDDIAPERFRSVAQFLGKGGGEMSLEQDEVVSLIEKNQTGWWLVLNAKGEHGFAPATFLEPVDAPQNADAEEWTDIQDSDRFWVTVQPYTAQSDDEISYDAGEEVELLATSNFGWWKIRYKGLVGLTPASHLGPRSIDGAVGPDDTSSCNRSSTYSTMSGIYATIKSPPPRRGSSYKDKRNPWYSECYTTETPREAPLQYAAVEIANSPPRSPGHRESTCYAEVIPRHLRGLVLPTLHNAENGHNGKIKMNGSPEPLSPSSPSSPVVPFINTTASTSDAEYATVRDPTAVRLPGCLGAKKRYLNVQSEDSDSSEAEYYTAVTNYNPPLDRVEDLALSVGATVRLLSVDGPWFFVSCVHLPERKGWVPSSVLKRRVYELSCLTSRRSFSVGDIALACKEEEEASGRKSPNARAPVPLPRKDRIRKASLELLDQPAGFSGPSSSDGLHRCAPPLPGEPTSTLERTQALTSPGTATINARYISASNYFPTNANCVSFRKGDYGILLEVNKNGWWRMNIDGVEGWTPGNYWEVYEKHDDQQELSSKRVAKSNDSEKWFQGKITRQECEEQMIGSAENLEFLVRESAQKFASYVLSVKYLQRVRHFPIELTPSHRFVIGKHVFNSLAEIVTYYKGHALFYTRTKEPVYLGGAFQRR